MVATRCGPRKSPSCLVANFDLRIESRCPRDFTHMKPIIAALVAIAVLWTLDIELNNGKYTRGARQMISSATGGRI
jgi:hypothetical protein